MPPLAHLIVAAALVAAGCATGRGGETPATTPAPTAEPAETAPSQVTQADLPPVQEPEPSTGRLRIHTDVSTAEVVVNGVTQGVASDFAGPGYLELEPGLHRIEIRKEGYASFRAEVVVTAEVLETIPVTLRKLPSTDPASGEQEEDEGYEEGET